MIDFVIFLFLVGVGYFSIYLFWAVLKVSNKRLGKTIFCEKCGGISRYKINSS